MTRFLRSFVAAGPRTPIARMRGPAATLGCSPPARRPRRSRSASPPAAAPATTPGARRRQRRHDRPGRLLDPAGRSTRSRSSRRSRRPPRARASPSRTRSAPRATSRARSRPACRPTSSTCRSSPTSTGSSTPGSSPRTTTTASTTAAPQNSVVVFVTRPGNPEGIDSWDDLVTGEVEVITPNPFTSGGARWNLMAAYGSQIAQGKSEDEALDFVAQVLENTPVQDASARDALQTFIGGKGDVLLSYENEAIGAIEAGEEVEYIVPDETILIETKAAVSEEADDPEAAQAFLDFLLLRRGPAAVRRGRLPAGQRGDPRRVRGRVPDAEGPVHDRGVRRLGDGRDRVLRSRRGLGRGDRARIWGWRRSEPTGAVATAKAPPRPSFRLGLGGPGLTRGLVVGYLSLMVLLPIAAVVATSLEGGLGAFWDAVTAAAGGRGAEADRDRVVDRRRDQRRLRDDDRLGPRPRRVPRQAVRQLAHRPAVRAADDRRRARPCSRSTARTACSGSRASRSPAIGVVMALLFVTLPFVIRSVQPVLLELDTEMEEAAASLGARPADDLPPRHRFPT